MKTKRAFIWLLTACAAVGVFLAANVLQNYGAYYFDDVFDGALAGLVLTFFGWGVLALSVRNHHKWRRYMPFWVFLFVLGIFAPHNPHMVGVLVYPTFGLMPLLFVLIIWTVKRYWTIRP